MSGLYIHVPFCAKRCSYCDFFTSTDQSRKDSFVESVCGELALRRDYLGGEALRTVYFGGGTPSQLSAEDFSRIFDAIRRDYSFAACEEITLEANPDDLTVDYLSSLRDLPFNRISMGVQSFRPKDLAFLNRRHDREQAIQAVANCKAVGISNISIDLIYGLPGQTAEAWRDNLREALKLDVPHISAYHLIYEEGTVMMKLKEEGKIVPVSEELSEEFFSILIDCLTDAGYLQYEISNIARPGFFSKHNSSYWNESKYLGIGPSAHSFDGGSRQWNSASIERYLAGIKRKEPEVEKEQLDANTRYNEYILTGLRTMWGIRTSKIKERFGVGKMEFCLRQVAPYIKSGLVFQEDDKLTLSRKGIFISDQIMSDLMWI